MTLIRNPLQNQKTENGMIDSAQQPIAKVRAFADLAENRGCYSRSQRANLDTAWTIFLKTASEMFESAESLTVQRILPDVDTVFRRYGSENRVSTSTVKAYQTRVKRLLDDFIAHNGGDFMAWKESLSRAASSSTRSRRRRRLVESTPEEPSPPQTLNSTSHRLVLSGGREGGLTLPPDLTDADIDPVWQQLEALKTLIRAQIAALSGKSMQ